jgi:ABC-type cobalamin/Fe3+-siderophores transport system ATPase subunit/SAM-dependent methyltransferase
MRVLSISQPVGQIDDGLSDIEMWGLNRIVILAGANGSGKSRLLHRVQAGIVPVHDLLLQNKYERGSLKLDFPPSMPPVHFVSKNLDLSDPASMTPNNLAQHAAQAGTPGTDHLVNSTLAYIQQVQNHWWNATHQNSREDQSVRDEMTCSYDSLRELIQTVLGESLERDLDNNPTLFKKAIAQAGLSDGQRLLLQWCIALHAQGISLAEIILLMDEPENHLHPESMISTIERIVEKNRNGQIWIATHSVPLIAALYKKRNSDVSLYFMDNGNISFASEQPEKVLKSLMGGEDNIEALREFVDLPEVFAINRFAAECLREPDVISHASQNDPQVQIVASEIVSSTSTIKLLDFGCGSGRLLDPLFDTYRSDLPQKVDYVGWDNSDQNYKLCRQNIEKAYQDATNRWFRDRQLLAHHHPDKPFDLVVLCNVLHEITPIEWKDLFNDTSIINQSLKDSGKLLIIEDYLMPKGEYAHPFGFIVLDTESLQKLFAAGSGDDKIIVKCEREGRIKGHFVPRHLLANVTSITVKEALRLAQRNAQEKINEIRNRGTHDFKSGRAHGFWVQQYANTTLALNQL